MNGLIESHLKLLMMRHLKKVVLLFCMTVAIVANAYAGNTSYPHKWNKIMNAIIQVESRGETRARSGNSVGILQITPVLVAECNKILQSKNSKKKYSLSDRFNPQKSKEMFILIMEKFNKAGSAYEACRIWGNGPYGKKKVRPSYWKKFLEHYNK